MCVRFGIVARHSHIPADSHSTKSTCTSRLNSSVLSVIRCLLRKRICCKELQFNFDYWNDGMYTMNKSFFLIAIDVIHENILERNHSNVSIVRCYFAWNHHYAFIVERIRVNVLSIAISARR